MMIPDCINGSFEGFGAVMASFNVGAILKQKKVVGVSLWPFFFWVGWGCWNLFYYPHLHQVISFLGGAAVLVVNAAWLILAIYYRRRPKGP
jgi:hypothetical protein